MNQSLSKQPDSWSFFDKIYCISLATRNDRREEARRQFAGVGVLDRVEFVITEKHSDNPEKGIFESHMHCLKKGLDAQAGKILVFEDDIFFERFDLQALHEICRYMELIPGWNGLFLGCITDGSQKTGHKGLVKITYRCLAHAYALNRSFAQKIVQEPWCDIPFDELLRRHNSDFYALYPMCAFQGPASSDNKTVVIDRMRRICGGLPFIQKANEFYQNHKMLLWVFGLSLLPVIAWLAVEVW